jgi:hypothetical protein
MFLTAGGLLFTRDSVNLQYTATATLLLSIYSKTLKSSGSSGVQCSATTFSPDQISSFAASQVGSTSSTSHMLSDFCWTALFKYWKLLFSGGLHPGKEPHGHVLHGRLQFQVPKAHSPSRLINPIDQGSPKEGHL